MAAFIILALDSLLPGAGLFGDRIFLPEPSILSGVIGGAIGFTFLWIPTIISSKGLEWGADDYVVKPFKQLELLAQAKALMRRQTPAADKTPVIYGQLHFNPTTFQLFLKGKEINLTRTEGQILQHLMKNCGHIAQYSSLAETVWGADYPGSSDSLKVYVRHLREKLEPSPTNLSLS